MKRERLWSSDYIKIMVAALGTNFVNYFFFAAIPMFAEELTGGTVYGGLLIMAYFVAALVARPLAGIASDKFGRVKLLIFGALMAIAACVLYTSTKNLALLLVIRVIHGFGFGIHSTCAGAVVADVVPKSRISEGVGFFGIYGTIGQAFAPWVALTIIGEGETGNFNALFLVSAGICLVSAAADCLLRYEREKKRAAERAETIHDGICEKTPRPNEVEPQKLPRTILGFELAVFAPALAVILMCFAISSINSFLILYAKWRGLENIGLFFTFCAVGVFISRFLFSRLADKKGSDIVAVPGMIALVILLALIPFARTLTAFVCIAFPLGIAQGVALPTIQSIMFKRCSEQRRGTASAAYFAALDGGNAIGAPILGMIADASSYREVYWVASITMLAALVFYIATASDKVFYAKAGKREITAEQIN